LAALKRVARSADGRDGATSLLPAAMEFFGVSEPNGFLARFYNRPWAPAEIAEFAPVVVRHAADGDETASVVLAEGARALCELVAGTLRNLKFEQSPEVVLLGGCVRSGAPYQGVIEAEISKTIPGIRLVEPEGSPLAGAARNALREGGVHVERIDFDEYKV
jgi:N-acetylglucosamine kinase-like BadF-type ATPase